MKFTLRPYQQQSVDDIRAAFRQGSRAPLLVSPTGSGKTVVFAYITEQAALRGNSIMIMVHRQEILSQTSRALTAIGVQHGVIAPRHTPVKSHVQVASVQTLVRRLHRVPCPELIIIDECHHSAAGSWGKILSHYAGAKLLGVTATPERLDGKGLGVDAGGFYDVMVYGPSVTELIGLGFLSKPVVYAPPTDLDLAGIRKRYGDYNRAELDERLDKPTITGCAVTHYAKHCPGEPAIAFCASVKHAEHVAEQFNGAGIESASIDGKLSDIERKARIDDLASGRIKVLTSCDIVSEGTDIPVVSAAILLRPTQSMGLHLQQCGRALRPYPGKQRTMILDHVGNTLRHGFPDDDREWSLSGRDKRERSCDVDQLPAVTQCQSCYRVFPATLDRCPECGWERPVQEREIDQVDGELQEIDEAEKRRIQVQRRREVAQARTLDELKQVARDRGYKPGWAYHIYQSRQRRGAA
jgi:superfamily II DNA or RNA helicase